MKQLLVNLQKQQDILNSLTEVTKQEQAAIINKNADQIQHYRQQKEGLHNQISLLEKEYVLLTNGKSLRDIAATAGENSQQLLQMRETLRASLRGLQSINATNMLLIRHELSYMSMLRELLAPESKAAPYNASGEKAQNQHPTESMVSIRA